MGVRVPEPCGICALLVCLTAAITTIRGSGTDITSGLGRSLDFRVGETEAPGGQLMSPLAQASSP